MKKFNKKMTLALFMSLCATSMSFALQKVTISVAATGADYTTILGAIQAAAAPTASTVLVNGDTIVVNVLEGTHTEPYVLIGNGLFASSKVLNVIVNGAGADKTILMGTSTGPTDANATNQRFWTLNDNTMGGTNLTFKNLTFSNYGGKTNANGANGAVIQFTPGLTPKAKINFINTVIKNCVGRALFISYLTNWDFNFENCLFKDNAILVASTGQAMVGILGLQFTAGQTQTGNLTLKNTTFMSNTFSPGGTATGTGALVSMTASTTTNTIMDNVVAVNNLFLNGSTTANTPMINISGAAGTTLAMNKVIMIGNVRSTTNLDKDILIGSTANVTVSGSGNVVNSYVEGSTAITEKTGFKINSDYNYIDSRIAFTMDGTLPLPLLTNDVYGVGHTAYSGSDLTTGIVQSLNETAKIYAMNHKIVVDGFTAPTNIFVYNTVGTLIYKNKVANKLEINVSRGLYIVKVNNSTTKLIVE